MRLTDKIAFIGMCFAVTFVIYMLRSKLPFIYKEFWRTYFYVMVYGSMLTLFAIAIPNAETLFTKFILISLTIFLSELVIYNIFLLNADLLTWGKYCKSVIWGRIFTIEIVAMLIGCIIIKFLK